MIVLLTDFSQQDPYVGQMKAVLADLVPQVPIIDLLHDVPDFNAHAGAHLLAALSRGIPADSVFLCVVDPGVGGSRQGVVLHADGRWYVGPDNGLLSVVAARANQAATWRIQWRPEGLSDTFHGRDLFAPVAGHIAKGSLPDGWLEAGAMEVQFDAADLPRVLYIDHYGNAWTGIQGGLLDVSAPVLINGQALPYKRTYSEAGKGEAFWYVNSVGLVEVAVNRGRAADKLGLKVGDLVRPGGSSESRLH